MMKKMIMLLFCVMSVALYQPGYADQKPPKLADTAPGYWNRPQSAENLYRLIRLRYVGPRFSEKGAPLGEVPIINLVPAEYELADLATAQSCQEDASAQLLEFFRGNPEVSRQGGRAWMDLKQGVMGSETASEYYFFRYVCLPMSTVDDLDMIGTQYQEFYIQDPPGNQPKQTIGIHYLVEGRQYLVQQLPEETKESNERVTKWHKELVAQGYATIIQSNDVRYHFWYDPARFFKRFEKYGITATIKIPDTKKDRDTWQDSSWNTMFKVLPLGGVTKLDTSGEKPGAGDREAEQKIYNNLQYTPKIPLWFNP